MYAVHFFFFGGGGGGGCFGWVGGWGIFKYPQIEVNGILSRATTMPISFPLGVASLLERLRLQEKQRGKQVSLCKHGVRSFIQFKRKD